MFVRVGPSDDGFESSKPFKPVTRTKEAWVCSVQVELDSNNTRIWTKLHRLGFRVHLVGPIPWTPLGLKRWNMPISRRVIRCRKNKKQNPNPCLSLEKVMEKQETNSEPYKMTKTEKESKLAVTVVFPGTQNLDLMELLKKTITWDTNLCSKF